MGAGVTLGHLRDRLGGRIVAEVDHRQVDRVAAPEFADRQCLAPLFSRKRLRAAQSCDGVLLVSVDLAPAVQGKACWVHEHAPWALATVLGEMSPPAMPRRSEHAVVEPGAVLGKRVDLGPGAVLMAGCQIGDDCQIGANAVVYGSVRVGSRVSVGAGAVLGRAGFGWVTGPDGQVCRMPQLGGVVVEDDVELGPLVTVDAGTLHPTRLGRGSKIDAHVHIGHNVQVGAGVMVAAQAGFAGSARIGAGVLVGGQVGVADHVRVGDGARLAAKAGVIGDVAPGATVAGYPAVARIRWLRWIAKGLRGSST